MFTQDKNDDFDWTRHSAATRDTKYTPNTGPSGDRGGSKQGKCIERESLRCQRGSNLKCGLSVHSAAPIKNYWCFMVNNV